VISFVEVNTEKTLLLLFYRIYRRPPVLTLIGHRL